MVIILIKKEIGKGPIIKALLLNPNSFYINYIMIITSYFKNITKYFNLKKEIHTLPIYGCKSCGYKGMLHRHGYYSRNAITRYSIHRINILRVKCPSCGKTHAVLPSFLIPYYQYSLEFIFECLYLSFILKKPYSKIVSLFNSLNPELSLNDSNISSFKKRMRENKFVINSFFANFDSLYYDMDNSSESAILKKINVFSKDIFDFNSTFLETMPRYFFSKI